MEASQSSSSGIDIGAPGGVEKLIYTMRCKLDIRDRHHKRRTVESVFIGSEAVGFLMKCGASRTREDAVRLMQQLVKKGYVQCIEKETEFKDSSNLYRFYDDEDHSFDPRSRRRPSNGCKVQLDRRSLSNSSRGSRWFFSPHTAHNSIIMPFEVSEHLQRCCNDSSDPTEQMKAVEKIRKAIVKEVHVRAGNWVLTKENKSASQGRQVQVYRRKVDGNFQICKTVGRINVPPREFVMGFIDFERRKNWEALFDTGYIVESIPGITPIFPFTDPAQLDPKEAKNVIGFETSARIIYRTTRTPSGLFAPRDVCSFQDCFMTQDGTYVVYEISVIHKDVPTSCKGYVRGEVFALVHCAQPLADDPSSSKLILITQFDSKGKLPAWLADMVIDSLQLRNFEELKALRIPEELKDVPLDKALTDDTTTGVGIADFELLTVLGRGGFGKVLQVRHRKTGEIYAMKVLTKSELVAKQQVERTQVERSILAAVHHPFIVQLAYAFQSELKLYMVMEFAQGGDFFSLIRVQGRIPEDRAKIYIAEIALALDHLHSLDVVYRDLKPENVLLAADGHVKLTDFGLSHLFEPTSEAPNPNMSDPGPASQVTYSFCGTERYMAPEMLLQLGHGKGVDWWCLGVLACEIMTTRHPFDASNHFQTLRNIVSQEPNIQGTLSEKAVSLIHCLLRRTVNDRLCCSKGLVELKAHPFFEGLSFDEVLAKKIQMDYVPKVKNSMDVSNFEEVFTRQDIEESIAERKPPSAGSSQSSLDDGNERRMFNFFTGWIGSGSQRGSSLTGVDSDGHGQQASDTQNPRLVNFSYMAPFPSKKLVEE